MRADAKAVPTRVRNAAGVHAIWCGRPHEQRPRLASRVVQRVCSVGDEAGRIGCDHPRRIRVRILSVWVGHQFIVHRGAVEEVLSHLPRREHIPDRVTVGLPNQRAELIPPRRRRIVRRVLIHVLAFEPGVVALRLQPRTDRLRLTCLHRRIALIIGQYPRVVRILAGQEARSRRRTQRRGDKTVQANVEIRARRRHHVQRPRPLIIRQDENQVRLGRHHRGPRRRCTEQHHTQQQHAHQRTTRDKPTDRLTSPTSHWRATLHPSGVPKRSAWDRSIRA